MHPNSYRHDSRSRARRHGGAECAKRSIKCQYVCFRINWYDIILVYVALTSTSQTRRKAIKTWRLE